MVIRSVILQLTHTDSQALEYVEKTDRQILRS